MWEKLLCELALITFKTLSLIDINGFVDVK